MNDAALLAALPVQRLRPAAYFPFWRGTLRDVAGSGAVLTPAFAQHWHQRDAQDGIRMDAAASQLTAPHFAEHAVGSLTILEWGWHQAHVLNDTTVRKLGTLGRYQYYTNNPTSLSLYNGTVAATLVTPVRGARMLAVTLENGSTPEFWRDGISVGSSVTPLTIPATDGVLYVAGPSADPRTTRSGLIIYPGPLLAAEIWATYEYTQRLGTPRKQWPGSGLRYPNRHTEQLTNGDFASWIPGTYPDPVGWGTVSPDTPENHITEDPAGHLRMVSNSLEFVGISQSALMVGQLYKCTLVVSAVVSGLGIVSGAGPNYFVFSTVAIHVFFFVADSSALILKRGTSCDITIDSISVIEQPADYVPHTGDPMYVDNIQTARVSLADETSGQLSNTGWLIVSGTWRMQEDATTGLRYIECIADGTLRRNLPDSDEMTTRTFTATGSAALVKGIVELQITATAGDTISVVELEAA